MVTNVRDNSYFIEWKSSEGRPAFLGLDGPIRPEEPVLLLPNKQEWVITKGEGGDVYQ